MGSGLADLALTAAGLGAVLLGAWLLVKGAARLAVAFGLSPLIVGATVVGPYAGELIHELMYMVGWEALPEEAAAFVHAHPTLSEAVGETLMSAAHRPLH